MCDIHYRKFVKYGDPLGGSFAEPAIKMAQVERIKRRILERILVDEDGCWIWKGNKNSTGYGCIGIEMHSYLAHRVSAYAFKGFNLNSPLFMCHKCDVPACVNPDHLFPGTPKDNTRDMMSKGRRVWKNGESINTAKLKAPQVLRMRLLFSMGVPKSMLTHLFETHPCTVNDIMARRSWKHL